ncbi:hypothetical protein HYPSUDRAFT_199073 [Hypholoma sublateritium FD-334 SS-4]|uniref:Uncharacterized protein n=1 Tax=Hypholoma sublateritium (strain FD-334 SS-4) TaxID=945553 RepID=A0A0D2Q3Y2_HYPSF|nr:hypothetical protein HYPSUDRAFT_199073 [Hypholoma sublateritium FD-334 SS-4]
MLCHRGAVFASVELETPDDCVPDISFDNWGGLSSLNGFDNFYGSNNFYGSSNEQVVIVEEEQVCHTQSVEIIQQQLAIIQEFSKRIILQQICDVETQVIVLQQFRGGLQQFQSDVTRQSSRDIGYDQSVSELIVQILQSDGSLNSNSFGFSGTDVGKNLVVPSGSNWNNDSSPKNISTILQTIHNGTNSTVPSSR